MKGAAPNPEEHAEQDLMSALLDSYADFGSCKRGEVVEGVIASVTAKNILVDIGTKCDAIVHPREVERMSERELRALRPGQVVKVYIVDPGEQDSVMLVSLSRAVQERDWDEAQRLLASGEYITLPVIDSNRGGVIVRLGRLRGFVPGSQLTTSVRAPQSEVQDPENRWGGLVGKTLKLRAIEVVPERNRLIFTERTTDNPQSRRAVLKRLEVGSVQRGVVSNIVDFGAFVNIDGVDGLLHVSELSWRRVAHASELLTVGQEVDVYILDVNLEQERLSLSIKRLTPDPWDTLAERHKEGSVVEVEVVNLMPFGAFACLVEQPEIEGLIHISELSFQKVVDPADVVRIGQRLTVRILAVNPEERRVAFSLKRVEVGESPETNDWRASLEAVHEGERVVEESASEAGG